MERDSCAPEDFYSTTNHRTCVRIGQQWIDVENQRMDAMIVVEDGRAICRRLRDLRAGDRIVVGLRGIRVIPESKERNRLEFAFMSNGISSERQVETAVRQTAALVRHAIEQQAESGGRRGAGGGAHGRRDGTLGADPLRLGAGAFSAATRWACTTPRPRCSAPRSASACPTAGRRSTGIAITCAPSTRSITRGR